MWWIPSKNVKMNGRLRRRLHKGKGTISSQQRIEGNLIIKGPGYG